MSDYLSFASFKSIFFHIILRYNIYFDINTSPLPLFFFSYFIKSPMFAFTRLSFRTLLKQIITCRYFSSCTTHDRCHQCCSNCLPFGLSSSSVFSGLRVAQSLVFCVMFCRLLFALQSLFIVLSDLLRYMVSDYPFGILIFFMYCLIRLKKYRI